MFSSPGDPDPRALVTRNRRDDGRWERWIAPTADGLPSRRVLALPLALLAGVFVVLVAFGVTGSSTGVLHSMVSSGDDPRLVAGEPREIRSDEWFVQSSWVISQVEQSLPIENETFPGGMDATVQNDLPNADWSTAFRPHLLGFFFLPLDQAMAFRWWFPGLGVIAATYLFAVTLLPRRPLTSLALAVSFFFAPFFQWWYLSLTLYPALWAMLVMSAIIWSLRSRKRGPVWILAALVAYLTPALAMGIYVPFIVPVTLVAAAFGVGAVMARDVGRPRFPQRLLDVSPVLAAGLVGGLVMVVWILTRLQTIQAFTSTLYPGERLQQVGQAGVNEISQLFSAFSSFALERTQGAPLSVNSSEASTFFLPGVFLVVVLGWLVWVRRKNGAALDTLAIATICALVLMLAYLLVPGWDPLAHLLFLDRTTNARMRIGFGVVSVVLVVLTAMRFDDARSRGLVPPLWVKLVATTLAAGSVGVVAWRAVDITGSVDAIARRDLALLTIFAAAFVLIVWLMASGRFLTAATGLLVLTLAQSGLVNPVYVGVLDLRQTETVQRIEQIDARDPGAWVGINTSLVTTMMLVESGVQSYNGVQGSPASEMWDAIDPTGASEQAWNRLATLSWVPGEGEPAPRNPAPDQIQMTFDSCDRFAAEHVSYVLTQAPLDQGCLDLIERIEQGPGVMLIYAVRGEE